MAENRCWETLENQFESIRLEDETEDDIALLKEQKDPNDGLASATENLLGEPQSNLQPENQVNPNENDVLLGPGSRNLTESFPGTFAYRRRMVKFSKMLLWKIDADESENRAILHFEDFKKIQNNSALQQAASEAREEENVRGRNLEAEKINEAAMLAMDSVLEPGGRFLRFENDKLSTIPYDEARKLICIDLKKL